MAQGVQMNPNAQALWRGPQWALALLLACLGMLGPFAIDAYLPAFSGIASALNASTLQMQQTLSAYLMGFAVMNLFHGALSDSVGRRPVVLGGVAVFALASAGCALAGDIHALLGWRVVQGMSCGAGMVVARAVIRDLFPPADAQRVMSQVTIYFGVAPAIAPLIGGLLFTHANWQAIFWMLFGVSLLLLVASWRWLPESLDPAQRQPLRLVPLLQGYRGLAANPRFMALAVASGIPFNGMFLYVLSAPTFLGEHLHLRPDQFFWFFCLTISGIMGGAFVSGRLAGKIAPVQQVRAGFAIMALGAAPNVLVSHALEPHPAWSMPPIAVFTFGWALMVPVVTIMVLDLAPERRGMASSLQSCLASAANAVVAGVVAPWVMHSVRSLAWAAVGMLGVGAAAWWWAQRGVRAAP
jgi:DHA1 family bicyclomycin/chloramphenicol resistance-like MFS transporter